LNKGEKMMNLFNRALLFGTFLVMATGCQNHIKNEVKKEKNIKRVESQVTYFLNVNQDIVDKPAIMLTLNKESKYKVVETEDRVTNELYTPYRGVYEFYEFPAGILVLPGAIVVNVVDFALLGLLPNHFTDDLLDISFTGMNPALNWESEERMESIVLNTESKEVDTRDEVVKQAAPGEKVAIEGELVQIKGITTDRKGSAKVYLHNRSLDIINNIEKLREVKITVKKGEPEETSVSLMLDRGLRMRLVKARDLIKTYNEDKSGLKLAKLVVKIEKLKFPRLAMDIENEELKLMEDDKEQLKQFKDEMAKLIKTEF